jgi:hypothetical protein
MFAMTDAQGKLTTNINMFTLVYYMVIFSDRHFEISKSLILTNLFCRQSLLFLPKTLPTAYKRSQVS